MDTNRNRTAVGIGVVILGIIGLVMSMQSTSLMNGTGNIWLGVADGIWRWAPGSPTFFPMPGESDAIRAFDEDSDGALLITTRYEIRRFVDGRTEPYSSSGSSTPLHPNELLRDRDGALWMSAATGVVHIHDGRTETFAQADGLSDDIANTLFEDREGNIWVGTNGGLDRFRDVAVAIRRTRT